MMNKDFLICAMSFERTSLSGFSFTGRGGAFLPSSSAPDFRFLDIFIAEDGRETPGPYGRMGKNGKAGPIIRAWNSERKNALSRGRRKLLGPFHLH